MPTTNAVNNGNMSAGVDSNKRLHDVSDVANQSGSSNMYGAVSNNTTLTNNYNILNKKYMNDQIISTELMNIGELTKKYFPSVIDIKNKILNSCQIIDFKYYIALRRSNKKDTNEQADRMRDEFKQIRPNSNGFNSSLPLVLEKSEGLNIDTVKNIGKGLLTRIEISKMAIEMWLDYYKNGSKFLVGLSGSDIPKNWTSQNNKFKDGFSNWLDFEISLSERINNESSNNDKSDRSIDNFINILEAAKNDNTFLILKESYSNFTILKSSNN